MTNSFYIYISNVDSMQMDMFIYEEYDENKHLLKRLPIYTKLGASKDQILTALNELNERFTAGCCEKEEMTLSAYLAYFNETVKSCTEIPQYGKLFLNEANLIAYFKN